MSRSGDLAAAAPQVVSAALAGAPTLAGRCRVIAIDGPAGSGKTTLAAAVAAVLEGQRRVETVHLDDLYDGWRGVLSVNALVCTLLRCLHADRRAAYRRYDWHRAERAEVRKVVLPEVLLIEGVGASAPACDDLVTLRVWVDAPQELRLRRGLERDGQHLGEQWHQFLADESRVHTRDRTRARADLVVDGTTGEVVAADVSPARAPHGRR